MSGLSIPDARKGRGCCGKNIIRNKHKGQDTQNFLCILSLLSGENCTVSDALKSQIPSPLKSQISVISIYQKTVF